MNPRITWNNAEEEGGKEEGVRRLTRMEEEEGIRGKSFGN